MKNIILSTDSYKTSHFLQYPPQTERVTSYIEARGSEIEGVDKTVFFGLSPFIQEYLLTPVTQQDVEEAKYILTNQGVPFNEAGWLDVVQRFGGYLPIVIRARSEGERVPIKTPLVVVENTDPKMAWLTSYVETALLRAIWYPTTVATISNSVLSDLISAAKITGTDIDSLKFKLHDFGARGVSSSESAMLGGMAHLINFCGTDTVDALIGVRRYFPGSSFPGFSIPAAEHSTMTSWGPDREVAAYRNMLRQFAKPGSIVAVVSDSYDIWNAVDQIWGSALKSEVEKSGSTVVIRPDSGDPITTPIYVIERLMVKFGYETNQKGFRVLPSCIRVIQGDGISPSDIRQILNTMIERGLAIDNIAFGMGGGLLQKVTRDTFKFAMKASSIYSEGEQRDIFKAPVGDPGKASKGGRFLGEPMREYYRKTQGPGLPKTKLTETFDEIRENMLKSMT